MLHFGARDPTWAEAGASYWKRLTDKACQSSPAELSISPALRCSIPLSPFIPNTVFKMLGIKQVANRPSLSEGISIPKPTCTSPVSDWLQLHLWWKVLSSNWLECPYFRSGTVTWEIKTEQQKFWQKLRGISMSQCSTMCFIFFYALLLQRLLTGKRQTNSVAVLIRSQTPFSCFSLCFVNSCWACAWSIIQLYKR